MRRGIIIAVGSGLAILAGVVGVALGSAAGHPGAGPDSRPTVEAAPAPDPTAVTTVPPLTAAGSEIYVDVPAVLTLADDTGNTVYVQATAGELTQPSEADAAATFAALPSLNGYSEIYEAPITIQLLSSSTDTARLGRATLSAFSIAVHPGDDPLLSSDTLTTNGCAGLPPATSQLHTGQQLSWCVHAFRRQGDASPIGVQYEAAAGPYTAAIIWASKTFTGPAIP